MSLDWQDAAVAVIAVLAAVFLYRHFRPRRGGGVTMIPTASLRVRRPRTPPKPNEEAE